MINIRQAWLHLSYDCNNKCVWCYASKNVKSNHKLNKKMSINDCLQTLNFLKSIGVTNCTLVGGDPTFYPEVITVLDEGDKLGLSFFIVTNGRKFSDINYAKSISSRKIKGISFSIEGSNSKIHDGITCVKGSFDETIQGIQNCIFLGMKPSTITTISASNRDNMLSIVEMLSELGQRFIAFNFCVPSEDNILQHNETLSFEELSTSIEEIYKYCTSRNIQVAFVTPFPYCRLKPELIKDIENKKISVGSCHMFYGTGIVVDYNHDILPCTHLLNLKLGSLKKRRAFISIPEFEKLWNVKIKNEFRNKLWSYPAIKCIDCSYWGRCTGGCPLFWLKYDAQEELKN